VRYVKLDGSGWFGCDAFGGRGPLTWHGKSKCWPVRISRRPVLYGGSRYKDSEPVMLQDVEVASTEVV
jgi:hypothetical protein